MATMSRSESKHMYSWWWVSHISPKNSKWLQENLTDMDSKVKVMIKLLEVEEDSFARRAEMYYKKRPELMKLVEEFYRAYRALAERYDHATGVIRQAHKTMAEAFPNQVPYLESDDNDSVLHTPEMMSRDADEMHKGALVLSPSDFHSAEKTAPPFVSRDSPFAKFAEGRARRGLNFQDADRKELHPQEAQGVSESDQVGRYETEFQTLKESLAKLEADKEAGLLHYQQSLQRLSSLEAQVLHAQEDSRGLHERATYAEAEVRSLRESLAKLEGEKEESFRQYEQCLDRISGLESSASRAQEDAEILDNRACEAEEEAQALKEELAQLKAEKEGGLAKYIKSLDDIADLENKLFLVEDRASLSNERADFAEKEVASLKEALARITEEKEVAALRYQQCLEKIGRLEGEIALSFEEAARLKDEMSQGAAKLKGAEEQCLLLEGSNKSMQTELNSVLIKMGIQNQELSENQKELGRLWTCIQEERLRFVEAEASLSTLQGLHSKTEGELRSVAAELQKRVQVLKDMEFHNQNLQGEVQKIRDENMSLRELNMSSAVSVKNMEGEILNLKEGKGKLQEELELRMDQRNALQQEIYCLKEELNSLNKKHKAIQEQLESMGFQPECFGSSVKDLQQENAKLKEGCQSREAELSALVERLGVMEKLIEKKALLEHSLSEINAELEDAREKVKALEGSCQSLLNEKATLISQLAITTENLEKLSDRNTLLENSLFDANAELEALRTRSKDLEYSCQLLSNEKFILVDERQSVELKWETTHQTLEELIKKHTDLEQSYQSMAEERESMLSLVEDLRTSLAIERQEHGNSTQLSHMQMTKLESRICVLQELHEQTRGQLGKELDKAVNAQFDIFILQNSLQDLKETNSCLQKKCQKMLETSILSDKLISELEYENAEQQEEVSFLSDQIKRLRMGMIQLQKLLEVDMDYAYGENLDKDQMVLHHVLSKLDDTRSSLCRAWDENLKLVIEKSVLATLLMELKQEVEDLKALIDTLQQEFRTRNDQLSSLQRGMLKLSQNKEELLLMVRDGNHKEELLASEMEILRAKFREMQGVCEDLQKDNCRILGENRSLCKGIKDLVEDKHIIEHDKSCLVVEAVALETLSFILKNSILEGSELMSHLTDDIDRLYGDNSELENKMRIMETMVGEYQTESMSLKASLEKYECEMNQVKAVNGELEHEIANGMNMLSQKVIELLEAEIGQQKQIHELSEKYNEQLKECECLREYTQNLDAELCRMNEKDRESNRIVAVLHSDLGKVEDEAQLWETVAGTFFVELQSSSVREAFYKDKFSELSKEYECLEDKANANYLEAMQMRDRVGSLKGENNQIKAQWAGYVPAMASLRDSVASLEKHILHTEAEDGCDKDSSDFYILRNGEVVTSATSDGLLDLQDISVRIIAVEKKVVERGKASKERSVRALKSQNSSRSCHGSGRASRLLSSEHSRDVHQQNSVKQMKKTCEDEGEIVMKDIMLDQTLEPSSHGKNKTSGHSKSESSDRIVELWDTVDRSGNIDLTVGNKSRKYSWESLVVEKELRVDSLELSKRFSGGSSGEVESNKKILDRLSSDVQKLTSLQISVEELKQKVVSKEKSIEYGGVTEQLEEAERVIVKLLDVNGKLVKNVQDCSTATSSSSMSIGEMGESGRRNKVSEQARRCSEKIGRVQLQVQKLQFLLLKLDGSCSSSKSKTETQMVERERKVVLRDYLYGGIRTPRRRKKPHFCGCVRPSTTGD